MGGTSYCDQEDRALLLLEGNINKTLLHEITYTYCLGPVAIVPWLIGLPQGRSWLDFDMDVWVAQKKSGTILWSYHITESEDTGKNSMYKNIGKFPAAGKTEKLIAQILANEMGEVNQSLYASLSSKDRSFWAELKADKVFTDISNYYPPSLAIPSFTGDSINLGVLDLESVGCKESIGPAVSDVVREVLLNNGYYQVMDRSDMDKILLEQDFQHSGRCDDMECIVKVGKILAVTKMVVGKVAKLGNTYRITLRLVDVESAMVDKIASESCTCPEDQLFLVAETAAKRLLLPSK